MLDNIHHIKDNSLLKNFSFKNIISVFNIKYTILPITILAMNAYVQHIYRNKELELIPLQTTYDKVMSLKNNIIVQKHKLNSNSEQFIQYIEQSIDTTKAKILDINVGEINKLSNIRETPIKINSTFVHDNFIFDFINKIDQYEGFVRTIAVKINKKRLNNGRHILETVLLCTLYTK